MYIFISLGTKNVVADGNKWGTVVPLVFSSWNIV